MEDEKREEVEHWLIKAEHDIRAANAVLKETPPITDVACFLAQQCVEKSFKGYLAFSDSHIEKIHDLNKLIGTCAHTDKTFLELIPLAKGMTAYAVKERYPDNWREIPYEEAVSAVRRAGKIMSFVKAKVGL